jgi:RNA polymerase sigma-70 factor (ECF subfamily)
MNTEDASRAGQMNPTQIPEELERLHPESFGWALHCCRHQRDEAEDVLQMVYVKVLEGRARFGGRSAFRTWLFGVVRHTAAEQRRRRWVRDALMLKWFTAEPPVTVVPGPEGSLTEAKRDQQLRAALQELPGRQRDVLHLVFYQELTVEEAAQALRISVGTARTHFDRGKGRLRQILASKEPT